MEDSLRVSGHVNECKQKHDQSAFGSEMYVEGKLQKMSDNSSSFNIQ